jgi:hypothetical protein
MIDADIALSLYRIFTGALFFYYGGEQYELRSPSKEIRYKAELLYNNIINEEKFHNWIREENLIPTMISLGVWHMNTDNLIKQLENKLDALKVDLYTDRLKTKETENNRKKIKTTHKEINKISNTKLNFQANTLEGYASSIKNEYIICSTLYKNNKRVFSNSPKDSASYVHFNNIVNEINSYVLSVSDYKSIARSALWKSYWNCGNKTSIFCKYTIDLTDEQRSLLNISRMYDSIYEHPECPEDIVIEDDDMLDGWMIIQKKNNEQAKKQKLGNKNAKIENASEVFLMTDEQDIGKVLDLNTDQSKFVLQEKLGYINSNKGSEVEDFNLPDVQRDLITKAQSMRKQ